MNLPVLIIMQSIIALVISQTIRMFNDHFRWQKHLELRSDKESIKRTILARASCSKSIPCSPGAVGEVLESNGSLLISGDPATPTYFGAFAAKATCNNTGTGFTVRLARLKPGRSLSSTNPADYLPGGLYPGHVSTFSEPNTLLLPVGVELCSTQKETIVCLKTSWIPPGPYPGPIPHPERGWYYLPFNATECGGVLPDATYLGAVAKSETCGNEQSVMVLQPSDNFTTTPIFASNPWLKTPLPWTGPGFAFVWLGGCGFPPSNSYIEAVFTRRE